MSRNIVKEFIEMTIGKAPKLFSVHAEINIGNGNCGVRNVDGTLSENNIWKGNARLQCYEC